MLKYHFLFHDVTPEVRLGNSFRVSTLILIRVLDLNFSCMLFQMLNLTLSRLRRLMINYHLDSQFARIAMPQLLFSCVAYSISNDNISITIRTKNSATKTTMMPPNKQRQKGFLAALTFRHILFLHPFLFRTKQLSYFRRPVHLIFIPNL